MSESLLLAIWQDPARMARLTVAELNHLLQETRALGLEARLWFRLGDALVQAACPAAMGAELRAQCYQPALVQAQARLEVRKVVQALAGVDAPILLLKGVGYLFAGLPVARGRNFSDLDILVPAARLADTEAALLAAGWKAMKADTYDQTYYRRWMHELPPLFHPHRGVVIDVHHAILPRTNRLYVDPSPLWTDSLALARAPLRVLAPVDLVLHSAAHLFADGEISGGLNNLLDLDGLLRDFGGVEGFYDDLLARARALGMGRPLYYALRWSQGLLGTPVPEKTLLATRAFAPGRIARWLMDWLVPTVLTPRYPEGRPAAFAAWLLYLRSHWLRMPPGLLAAHLGRKLWRRVATRTGGGD